MLIGTSRWSRVIVTFEWLSRDPTYQPWNPKNVSSSRCPETKPMSTGPVRWSSIADHTLRTAISTKRSHFRERRPSNSVPLQLLSAHGIYRILNLVLQFREHEKIDSIKMHCVMRRLYVIHLRVKPTASWNEYLPVLLPNSVNMQREKLIIWIIPTRSNHCSRYLNLRLEFFSNWTPLYSMIIVLISRICVFQNLNSQRNALA